MNIGTFYINLDIYVSLLYVKINICQKIKYDGDIQVPNAATVFKSYSSEKNTILSNAMSLDFRPLFWHKKYYFI